MDHTSKVSLHEPTGAQYPDENRYYLTIVIEPKSFLLSMTLFVKKARHSVFSDCPSCRREEMLLLCQIRMSSAQCDML